MKISEDDIRKFFTKQKLNWDGKPISSVPEYGWNPSDGYQALYLANQYWSEFKDKGANLDSYLYALEDCLYEIDSNRPDYMRIVHRALFVSLEG